MKADMVVAIPAAGQGGDHLVHEAAEIIDRHARNHVFPNDNAGAPLLSKSHQASADETSRRAEGPYLEICSGTLAIKDPLARFSRAGKVDSQHPARHSHLSLLLLLARPCTRSARYQKPG